MLVLAGTLVALSALLIPLVSQWWVLLAAFVGLNLAQSSLTGSCPAGPASRADATLAVERRTSRTDSRWQISPLWLISVVSALNRESAKAGARCGSSPPQRAWLGPSP
ncbi:DUF2892 domain-containing protein [Nocardioides sp. Arc9.136]|uniref:YgaP family membrane protein n=1 Tax=Nocardioides sp. Arc9.136 TaxID=2996826 RepID=UPI002665153E|nr:DUF2892 domain-containing protein [Nocardioides sp. Arc9.136]WKN50657.1 DUF2892 domain-containing protein [Nocardioides sp. Arc9.136]